MGVRRVPFKDWVWEVTAAAPARWHAVTGALTVQTNTVEGDDSAGGTPITAVAPCEGGVVTGVINQAGAMYFDVTMNMVSKLLLGTPVTQFIMFASASVGTYLDDSYVLEMTPIALTLYRSDNNVLTSLATTAIVHAVSTEYDFVIARSTAGVWTISEDGVAVPALTVTDTTYTTGSFIGAYTADAKSRWSQIRARYPYCSSVVNLSCRDVMTRAVAEVRFECLPMDLTDKSDAFTLGEGIEVVLYDGSNYFVDFYGKIEKIEAGDEGPDVITCYDWRIELHKGEGVYSGSDKVSVVAAALVALVGRVLTTGGVKATTDAGVARTMNGESAFACMKKLAAEAGFQMFYTGTGKFLFTDATTASGLTISDTKITKFRIVSDLTLNVNTAKTYYSGGNSTVGGSGTDYNTYGRATRLLVDTSCPDATQADARSNYAINNGGGSAKIIDVWTADETLAAMRVGDTCTLTSNWLNPAVNATAMIIEKEYDSTNPYGIRYRLNVEATPRNRFVPHIADMLNETREAARWGLGMQV